MKSWIKRISRRDRVEGEILPPWYYGLAYLDYAEFSSHQVFYVIPINYVIKAWGYIRYTWNYYRSKRTWMDREIIRQTRRYQTHDRQSCMAYMDYTRHEINDALRIVDKIRNGVGYTRILADDLENILKNINHGERHNIPVAKITRSELDELTNGILGG